MNIVQQGHYLLPVSISSCKYIGAACVSSVSQSQQGLHGPQAHPQHLTAQVQQGTHCQSKLQRKRKTHGKPPRTSKAVAGQSGAQPHVK